MNCLKVLGRKLAARDFDRQTDGLQVRVAFDPVPRFAGRSGGPQADETRSTSLLPRPDSGSARRRTIVR